MAPPDWLPPLETFAGDWPPYENTLYEIFVADFVTSGTTWRGKRVSARFTPPTNGKGFTFWHVITGDENDERVPDMRRCERIRWIKAVIEAPERAVRTWTQRRGKTERVAIALPDFAFIVFVQPRGDRVHLLTAYFVEEEHRREQYAREWALNKR